MSAVDYSRFDAVCVSSDDDNDDSSKLHALEEVMSAMGLAGDRRSSIDDCQAESSGMDTSGGRLAALLR